MPDKQMLNELRQLAESEKIPTASALRLILGAVADLYECIDTLVKDGQETRAKAAEELECQDDSIREIRDLVVGVKSALDGMQTSLTSKIAEVENRIADVGTDLFNVKTDIENLKKNPSLLLGNFAKEHPRWSAFTVVLIFIFLNLWFVSGFRRAVLILLHVPPEIIDLLNATGTPVP